MAWLHIPSLPSLISHFLYEQYHPDLTVPVEEIPLEKCPKYTGQIYLYPSTVATYHTPSDKSGLGGLFCECIQAVHLWRGGPARCDCVFIAHDEGLPSFRGLYVGQVIAFLKLAQEKVEYPTALITWFETVGDSPCPSTGMWKVHQELDLSNHCKLKIIHLDTILHGAHLVGIAGSSFIPYELDYTNALDAFKTFYVNKFIDYHAYEIAF